MKLPSELPPTAVIPLIDTREQHPLVLPGLGEPRIVTLPTADYSVLGLEHVIAGERKSEPDLVACVGPERPRFDHVCQRMLAYPVRFIIVESTWSRLEAGEWRSKVTPQAVIGSCLGWIAQGIPIIMAGDHDRAGRYMARLLYTAARRRWREARALAVGIEENVEVPA